MKILIIGAGIAGLSLAYWLFEYGHEVAIIEKAETFKQQGFLIGIRGASISVLQKMKLLDKALDLALDSIPHDILSSKGKKISRRTYLSYKENENGKLPLNRADLHKVLYEAIRDKVEIRFGTEVKSIEQEPNRVDLEFVDGSSDTCDLLIGADGIHSQIRKQVFGEGFEQIMDASYAAFISPKTQPIKSEVQFAKGRMSIIYDLNKKEFGGIFILKGNDFACLPSSAQKTALIQAHEMPMRGALETISPESHIFVDRLIQIDMPEWVSGRVALLGDAAYGLSPASGFGATAAICGAYILGKSIDKLGQLGLAAYEKQMRPDIEKRRKSSASTVKLILNENPFMVGLRDFLLRLTPEEASHKQKRVADFGIEI